MPRSSFVYALAWLCLLMLAPTRNAAAATVRDEFNGGDYGGSDGSDNWSSDWLEFGESNGPHAPYVHVVASSYCADGNCLLLGLEEDFFYFFSRGAARGADLDGSVLATLSFDYWRRGQIGEIDVMVSGNGGSSWTAILDLDWNESDSELQHAAIDITPYVSSNTQILFGGNAYDPDGGGIYIDNVEITFLPIQQIEDIAVSKAVSNETPAEGEAITYTVTVSVVGTGTAGNVEVTDQLPAGLSFLSAVPSQGGYDSASGVWSVGSINAGDSATLELSAGVDPGTGGSVISNTATLTNFDYDDSQPANNSDSVDITVLLHTLALSAEQDTWLEESNPDASHGDDAELRCKSMAADSKRALYRFDLTPIPAGAVLTSAVLRLHVTDPDASGEPVGIHRVTDDWTEGGANWSNTGDDFDGMTLYGSFAPGEVGEVLVDVSGLVQAWLDNTHPNQGLMLIAGSDDIESMYASREWSAPPEQPCLIVETTGFADLAVSKGVDEPAPAEGESITYTVTVQNGGPDDCTQIEITDSLPAGLSLVSANPSQGSYDEGSAVWDLGSLATGQAATLQLGATVDPGTAGTVITNSATVTHAVQGDGNPDNNSAAVAITVQGADLALDKAVDDPAPNAGDIIVFTLTLQNLGPDSAAGIVVYDPLPAGLSFDSADASQGAYDQGSGLWTAGTLDAGMTATLDIAAAVDPGTEGTIITNTASITAIDIVDPDEGNNADSVAIAVAGVDLSLGKTVDNPQPEEGDQVEFTLTLQNLGPADATGVAVADTLPAGLDFASALPSQGSYDDGSGIWDVGSLSAGGAATLVLNALVASGTAGSTIINNAAISAADQVDPVADNNADSAELLVRSADLSMGKKVDDPAPHVGDPVTFNITVLNNGPDDAEDIVISDPLPAGLIFAAALPSQGSYDEGAGIWSAGAVAAGDSAEMRLTAFVDDIPAETVIINTATLVSSDPSDPIAANDSASVDITVKGDPAADLSLEKTVDLPVAAPGDTVTFFVVLDNLGPDTATGVLVNDPLPAGLSFISANPSRGSYDPVSGLWSIGVLQNGEGVDLSIVAELTAEEIGSEIVNTAIASSVAPVDPEIGNNSDTATVSVAAPGVSVIEISASEQDSRALLPGATPDLVLHLELLNTAAVAETLQSLSLLNGASGAGSQDQLDADWTPLTLHAATQTDEIEIGQRMTVSFENGIATFSDLYITLPSYELINLNFDGGASLAARDGDILDVFLDGDTGLVFSRHCSLDVISPLDPEGSFPVDGMAAEQISVSDVGTGNLMMGSQRNLAFDALLPANGYELDVLEKLNVRNWGNALAGEDIEKMELWADGGDGIFEGGVNGDDALLGSLVFTGDRWELTALSEPVQLSGLRIFISVDIAEDASAGRGVWLGFPADPADVALGMISDNDGPLDAPVRNSAVLTISTEDRVTLSAFPLPGDTVQPGEAGVFMLQLMVNNSYAVTKTLTALTVSNASSGVGGQAELDGEIETLFLYQDSNDDLVPDELLSTAFNFSEGRTVFDGFTWELPADTEEPRHLFVFGNVSLMQAADEDRLALEIADIEDLQFSDLTTVSASWPVSSGAEFTVDGMLAGQIINHGAPVATLGPDEGPALAMDLVVPPNGYAYDLFQHFKVLNLGTATDADLAELHLWRDGGDGIFGDNAPYGSDDIDLSALAWLEGAWQSAFFTSSLAGDGARIFVSFTVSSTPTDSATVRLAVPVNGITVASGNDGPIDLPVENPEAQLLSSAPLLATLWIDPVTSIVGQDVDVHMEVRNLGSETVNGISPSPLLAAGDGLLAELSGPLPIEFDLVPGELDTFRWIYRAEAPGDVQLSGNAEGTGESSGLTRYALETQSNTHSVFVQADSLELHAVESMPHSVNQGQTGVVPFHFTFSNTGSGFANVLLTALRIRLDDGGGGGIVPADLLSRVVVSEGSTQYLEKTTLESSGAEVDLTLDEPVLIDGLDSVTLGLQLDISVETTVPQFMVIVSASHWFVAEDATSGYPVEVFLDEGGYPLESDLAHLELPPTQLVVAAGERGFHRVSPGQAEVPLQTLILENPGIAGMTADILVPAFTVSLRDTSGSELLPPNAFLSRIRVRGTQQDYLDRSVGAGEDSTLTLSFSPLIEVAVGEPLSLEIEGDLLAESELGLFRLQLEGELLFTAQDANTGEPVSVLYEDPPLLGNEVQVEAVADTLLAARLGGLPSTIVVGDEDVSALVLRIQHPGELGAGRIHCLGMTVRCWDEARDSLPPATFIDRLRVLRGEEELAVQANPPATGGSLFLPLSDLLLEAGDNVELELLLDVEPTAPSSFLELAVDAAGWLAVDVNSGASVLLAPATGEAMPLASGLAWLESPARDLAVGMESLMPAVLAAQGCELPIARISLRNAAPAGAGPIRVDHIIARALDRDMKHLAIGEAVLRVRTYLEGELWAESAELSPDSVAAWIQGAEELCMAPGVPLLLELRAVLRDNPAVESLRLGLSGEDIGVVQPGNGILQVQVQPEEGQVFPLWSEEGNFSPADLRASYSNFPSPFAAGRESTVFAYYLSGSARVTLRIWTARGELVLTLLDAELKAAGLQQDDRWDGLNGRGRVVANGVYLAELQVNFDDGSRERLLRKLAVLR